MGCRYSAHSGDDPGWDTCSFSYVDGRGYGWDWDCVDDIVAGVGVVVDVDDRVVGVDEPDLLDQGVSG